MEKINKLNNEMGLRIVADNFAILTRGGMDMICPYVPPLTFRQPRPSSIVGGAMQEEIAVQKTPCSNGCPLFNLKGYTVEICCGSSKVEYTIKNVEDQTETKKPVTLQLNKNDNTIN